jgi:HAE1 family hydrophobic/amphiphilic exporter-1
MISRFFIYRPIFASVVSIVILLIGTLALTGLPIAQYPELAPPTVQVRATYPGADAKVLADTVAQPIEEKVNGVENSLYMSSTCASDGSYVLTVTFETGTDLDIASVQVQNRVSTALPRLPEEVKRTGVETKKQSTNFAVMVSLISPKGTFDDIYLANYATMNIRDVLSRVNGVGDVRVLGAAEYSMRLWLDPEKLQARGITTIDVTDAIREQNIQVAAGIVGQPPAPTDLAFQYTVTTKGRLSDVEEFEDIIIKTGEGGRHLRVRDVGRVELGGQNYNITSTLSGTPATTIMVYQLPGANLLAISDEIKAQMVELGERFPDDLEYVISYDASDVVEASISEIVETLFIAAALVILTVLIFLQDLRATIIPTVTIPVSLIGTFAVMALLGFSLNSLTLFGLVLAIGIVVDDAIVVVENVSRNIDDTGMSPKEATVAAMKEVTGPVIATTLVLLAVFIPTAFMGGLTGTLYNQFGLTIAAATVFSSLNALTMSPALCGLLLRKKKGPTRNPLWIGFNALLGVTTKGYTGVVTLLVRRLVLAVLFFAAILVATYFGFVSTPSGFVPEEDQGYVMVNVQLPDGATQQRTQEVVDKIDAITAATPGVKNTITFAGYSLLDSAVNSNAAGAIVVLEHWDERPTPETKVQGILRHLMRQFSQIEEGVVVAFNVPAIPGLGLVSGFDMQLQDRGAVGLDTLQQVTQEVIESANAQSGLTGLYSSFRANVPQIYVDVDREKVKRLGIPLQSVFDTLQTFLGSAYVNDFTKFNRVFQVRVQADAPYRASADDIRGLQVRDRDGNMIPLGSVLTVNDSFGPQLVTRYNMYPAASIKGRPAEGHSSGQAIGLMNQISAALPASMGTEWTGQSFQEIRSGNQAPLIFGLALILVYLVLAAQYESWGIPLAVILAVPLGVLGAMAATLARGLDNNTYTQVGLVLLVALVSKNAILIVEFARERRSQGLSVKEAAIESARLRFRPILMTAISFILGTFPLVIATGAGAASRVALGTAVMGGMVLATVLGVLLTPALYALIQGFAELFGGKPKAIESEGVAETAKETA